MKFAKNRIAAITISMFLMLSIAASTILIQTAKAHTPAWEIPTFAYVQAVPNPVGVIRQPTCLCGLNKIPDGALQANDIRLHNYNLTIVAPDGTKTTKIFATVSDTTSNQYYVFTPTKAGIYTLYFNFPGQVSPNPKRVTNINDTYMASSASTTLTVQARKPVYPNIQPIASNPSTGHAQYTVRTGTGGQFRQNG